MKVIKFSLIFLITSICVLVHSAFCQNAAFIDVNVVPMDSSHILANHDVVVENGIITDMGPTNTIQIPPGAVTILGSGNYLMPGLADMHVHIYSDVSPWNDMWGEEELILFLANGVTTIRNMWGDPGVLTWRDSIQANQLFGPTIYTTGELIDGPGSIWVGAIICTTAIQGRALVISQKAMGYDYIKVYNKLSSQVYYAILDEANNQDIPVIGHVPYNVGLFNVLSSGQYGIEHFDGYYQAFGFVYPAVPIWANIDSTLREQILNATIQSGVWNCPTMAVRKNYVLSLDEYYQFLQRPYVKYVPQAVRDIWRGMIHPNNAAYRAIRENTFYKKLLKALHERDGNLILGTDCPNPFVIPGFSIYEELQLFVDAGLTLYEAIKCGTYDAAVSLDSIPQFGTVEVGKRADLILLNNNPLDSVTNVQDRIGVMARGNWYTEQFLQLKLDTLEYKYSNIVESASVNKAYQKPGIDTLWISSRISNPFSLPISVEAVIESYDLSIVDSIPMFDDGLHRDSLAGDDIFGCSWFTQPLENNYKIHIHAYDSYFNKHDVLNDAAGFTTVGPVKLDSFFFFGTDTIPNPGDSLFMKLVLKNESTVAAAVHISSNLVTIGSGVQSIASSNPIYGNINPLNTKETYGFHAIKFADNWQGGVIHFSVEILSDNYVFWNDTFSIDIVSGIEIIDEKLPKSFSLKQNYPNPFNPSTTIEFGLPKTEFVNLKIYNLLGQKVATLVSKKLISGSYKYTWDASQYASGVYFYKLEAGDPSTSSGQRYIKTKKLIFLK